MLIDNYLTIAFWLFLVYLFGLPTLKAILQYLFNKETEEKNFYQMLPYSVSFVITIGSLIQLIHVH